ncbi:MAG: T9SS type A sorting domain-containing protein [Flavobacteriales bacterium]
MKKISTSLLLLTCSIASFSQNGQIMNGGFENWTTSVIYESPATWKSSNTEEFQGVALTTKSADAQHLLASVKLDNEVVNGDSLFGYVYLGSVSAGGVFRGIPYGTPFDMINGFWKGNMQTGDTAYMICQKSFMGVPYPPVMAPIFGNASSWTAFSFPITAGPCDSVFIGFVSSNPFDNSNFHPNSTIQFDNVSFSNSGPPPLPLPNPSFESWNSVSASNADNWNSINSLVAGAGVNFVSSTTDFYSGTKAASIKTLYMAQWGDTIPGFITNGAIGQLGGPNPFTPIAYNASPVNFSGYYKYAPSGTDGAQVSVEFFQAGASIGGYGIMINSAAAAYTLIGGAVNLTGVPDSMLVFVQSGFNPGSEIKIDDFMLSGGNVGIQEMARKLGFKTYPNPTDGMLSLEWDASFDGNLNLEIVDLSGRLVYSKTLFSNPGKNNCILDLTSLSSGPYSYRVSGADVTLSGKVIKE